METFIKIMTYIMSMISWVHVCFDVCCDVTDVFPGQLFCWLCSVSITPPHLCNNLWLPLTTHICCTCWSPITATCLVYLTPVRGPSFFVARCNLSDSVFLLFYAVCVFLCFYWFLLFGKMRNPVKCWGKKSVDMVFQMFLVCRCWL